MGLVLDRYGAIRQRLARISKASIAEPESRAVAVALGHFRIIEEKLERARADQRYDELNSADFNGIVSKQIDELEGTMISVRRAGT